MGCIKRMFTVRKRTTSQGLRKQKKRHITSAGKIVYRARQNENMYTDGKGGLISGNDVDLDVQIVDDRHILRLAHNHTSVQRRLAHEQTHPTRDKLMTFKDAFL